MNREIRQRFTWISLYQQLHDAGLVCRRCGISRPTLRKWIQRYQEQGDKGLLSKSRKPINQPKKKIFQIQEEWILSLRKERKLGARRIQHELERLHNFHLSLATIQKVRQKHKCKQLVRKHRKKDKRYQKSTPGECVQVDTIKIGANLYQYTAIDDCTRFILTMLFPARNAENTVEFLEMVKDGMPFPVQRIQTDRGTEFTSYLVQEVLQDWKIKWRPNRPRSPHLNGKVERVQKTILDEFYETVDLRSSNLQFQLSEWEYYYNHERVHGALGVPPIKKINQLESSIPSQEEIALMYDEVKEYNRIRFFGFESMGIN